MWTVMIGVLLLVLLVSIGARAYNMILGSDTGLLGPEPVEHDAGTLIPAPGYALVEDDSGKLSVEIPSEWDDLITGRESAEGEKGSDWSSVTGENANPSISAVNDRQSWRTGSRGHRGTYIMASKELAQRHTDDELVALGPNDYSASCEAGAPEDFNRPPYSGKRLDWKNCGGSSDHTALTLAAAPEDRECVVLLQVGEYGQADEESRQHILDTFDVDCEGIS